MAYLDLIRIVVGRPIGNTNKTRFFDHADEARAKNEALCLCHHTEQVPPGSKANCLLQTTGSDITNRAGAGIG